MNREQKIEKFVDELAGLINCNGIDTEFETPDFLLAEIAIDAMASFASGVATRDKWFGTMRKELEKRKGDKTPPPIPPEIKEMAKALERTTGKKVDICVVEAIPVGKKKGKKRSKK